MRILVENEKVTTVFYTDDLSESMIKRTIEINLMPKPEKIEDKETVMYYRNGKIEYEYVDIPAEKEPELTAEEKIAKLEQELKATSDAFEDFVAMMMDSEVSEDE